MVYFMENYNFLRLKRGSNFFQGGGGGPKADFYGNQ